MRPTSAPRRHARAIARRAEVSQPAIAGAIGTIVPLMLVWGVLIVTGLGLH